MEGPTGAGRTVIAEPPTADPAFAAFCKEQYPTLVGLLSLHVGDRRIAEELSHDALVRAQEQWERVRGMDAPGAWLRRVGLNLANSWWRRRFAERRANRLAAAGAAADGPADAADALAVRTAVAALPRRQRTAITLRYFVGLSVAETATEMGCADGTVKSLSSQAIAALRTTFTDLEEVDHHV